MDLILLAIIGCSVRPPKNVFAQKLVTMRIFRVLNHRIFHLCYFCHMGFRETLDSKLYGSIITISKTDAESMTQ